MAKKTMCFDLNSSSIKIKELMKTKDFLMIELWAISDEYPNNNTSHFPYATMQENVNNKVFYNKPILGKFNNVTLNYETHNSQNKYDPEFDIAYKDYENGERPLGVIRESDSVRIETDKDGLHWIVFTAILWVKYNYQGVKKILKSKTSKVSVEVTVFESHFDDNEIEIFDKWMFDGVTILGYRPHTTIPVKEGINNAHLTILEKMGQSEFSHQIKSLQFAYDEFDKENDIKENDSRLYIEKNKEEEGIELLTYEQKRDLLQEQLHTFLDLDKEWGYVCDLDDNNVYFRIGDVTYRAVYSINEDGTDCTLSFSEKVRIINSWKDFEEEVLTDSESNQKNEFEKENNPSDKEEDPSDKKDDSSDKEENLSNEEENLSEKEDDKKKEESCGNEKTCDEDPEDKDDSKKDDTDDDTDDGTDDTDKDDVDDKVEESDLEGEMFEDPTEENFEDNKEKKSKDEDEFKEDDKKDCYEETQMESQKKFIINDVGYTDQEIFDMYNDKVQAFDILQKKYDDLTQDFEECKNKCDKYEAELQKNKNEKIAFEVKKIAEKAKFSEEELNDIVARCNNGEFSSLEEATKEIAYQAFMKQDAEDVTEKEEKTEFSAKADIHVKKKEDSKNKMNSFEQLKNYVNK